MRFPPADQVQVGTYYELSTHLIALDCLRRGGRPHWLRRAAFVVDIDGRQLAFNMTRCVITSTVAVELARKDYTRTLLRRAHIAVARGGTFALDQYDAALARAYAIGWPVVVKPSSSGKGDGVSVGVSDEQHFSRAWKTAASPSGRIVVERQQRGMEARFFTVLGRCVAVVARQPPTITGDGTSTVQTLIDARNKAREDNPHLQSRPFLMDEHRMSLLISAGYRLDSVLSEGEELILDEKASFSAGGDSIDLTDVVHPDYCRIAERAEAAIPGLGLGGIDIIAEDLRAPAAPDNHIVLEVNSRPAIGAHHFPWIGESRDVAGAIVEACLRH